MSLQIQPNMRDYKGSKQYLLRKGCIPIATWVDIKCGFKLLFRHIFSNRRQHIGNNGWTYYPHDRLFEPGFYRIDQETAEFLMKFYRFQIKKILQITFDTECSVCLEEITVDDQAFIFSCKHMVHVKCCRKNAKKLYYYTCPNCRQPVTRIDTINIEQEQPIITELVTFLQNLNNPIKASKNTRYIQYTFHVQKTKIKKPVKIQEIKEQKEEKEQKEQKTEDDSQIVVPAKEQKLQYKEIKEQKEEKTEDDSQIVVPAKEQKLQCKEIKEQKEEKTEDDSQIVVPAKEQKLQCKQDCK